MPDSFITDSFTEATIATRRLCLLDRHAQLEHVLFWIAQHELSLQTKSQLTR